MVKRILFIEDNDYHRLMVEDYLISKHYQILSLPNGDNVFAAIADFQPEVILLDLHLPTVDGYQILEKLQLSQWCKLPVIVISAYAFEHHRQKALDLGAFDYLSKPIQLENISQAIMSVEHIPLKQILERYQISLATLQDYLQELNIQLKKEGEEAYLHGQKLQLLDAFHKNITQGGTVEELPNKTSNLPNYPQSEPKLLPTNTTDSLGEKPSSLLPVLEAIMYHLTTGNGNRLAYLRELEEAYEKNWLLGTKELADLLGLSTQTIRRYGKEFEDAGFIFTRVGTRKSGEVAWKVGKL